MDPRHVLGILLSILLLSAALFVIGIEMTYAADKIPQRAHQYRRLLTQAAQTHWGLGAPVSLFAAQVHQESAWRKKARSPYAHGLAQFTPGTAKDVSRQYPKTLGANAPYSPKWALQALVIYNRQIYRRLKNTASDCDRWAMTLAGYNGGPGWIGRDRRLAAKRGSRPNRWWGHVEKHSRRAQWAFKENRDYPHKIIKRLQPLYHRAGWGGRLICGETA